MLEIWAKTLLVAAAISTCDVIMIAVARQLNAGLVATPVALLAILVAIQMICVGVSLSVMRLLNGDYVSAHAVWVVAYNAMSVGVAVGWGGGQTRAQWFGFAMIVAGAVVVGLCGK